MDTKTYTFNELRILKPFFEDPEKKFQIREVSRAIKINPTTIRKYLNEFVQYGYLKIKKENIYPSYSTNFSKQYLNLKLFYNLEKIRNSGIIEEIEKEFEYPAIILFGSYSKARDFSSSDIDLCIISEVDKEFNSSKYEKMLNRKIQIHKFNKKEIKSMKEKNKELINNILNG
ncbi:nucleotidyltransferase domain-containing protein, partial [Candidatus Pacearchaeota archaeon]|nr:nucleotidyltransferase domain-containing protein [Candidatus Pacearchaeota archaeon]